MIDVLFFFLRTPAVALGPVCIVVLATLFMLHGLAGGARCRMQGGAVSDYRSAAIASPSVTAVNTFAKECRASGNCSPIASETMAIRLDPPT